MERSEEGPDGTAVRKAMWSLAVVLKKEFFVFLFFLPGTEFSRRIPV